MLLYITKNMNPNYIIIPCFVEKIQNNTSNMCYIKIEFVVFYYKYLSLLLLFFNASCLLFSSLSLALQNSPLLNYPKSHHHDPNNKNSKFKLTNCLVHPKSHTNPNPLTVKFNFRFYNKVFTCLILWWLFS